MRYLITGGNFNNKGAEAMTLVALYNVFSRDSKAIVFWNKSCGSIPFDLSCNVEYLYLPPWTIRKKLDRKPVGYSKERIRDIIKFFVPGYSSSFGDSRNVIKILDSIDVLIDISGFGLSSQSSEESNYNWLDELSFYMNHINKAYLMPQSFGPFNFSEDLAEYAKSVLSRMDCIFVRENSGLDCLKQLGLSNAVISADSVLIDRCFSASSVIADISKYTESFKIKNKKNLAIVPNARLFDVGDVDFEACMNFYLEIIDKYAEIYDVWLVSHAGEDLPICNKIKEKCNYKNVYRIDHVMHSFNYEELVSQMDFVVASRYHSIVHAYKRGIPSVILGWAEKYSEIAKIMNQEKYLVSLDAYDDALNAVDMMVNNATSERRVIMDKLHILQTHASCYDWIGSLNN